MIQETRIRALNECRRNHRGRFVLYWMQASQRTRSNHALEYAIERANELNLPLLVWFGLTDRYPGANARHYRFMLEGIAALQERLRERGIRMIVERADPATGAIEIARRAAFAVTDAGYLRHQRLWRATVAGKIEIPLVRVESDVLIPVETASDKMEIAARTLRPRIDRIARMYLVPVQERSVNHPSDGMDFDAESLDLGNPDAVMDTLDIDRTVAPVTRLRGGGKEARTHLDRFVREKLETYHETRNDPNQDSQSNLSPYLHFGQISPLEILLRISEMEGPGVEAFIEELVVRRELAINFARYQRDYDSYTGIPEWARKTLAEHAQDPRPYLCSAEEFESGQTHDPVWNAAQKQLVRTGKMHGYLRMYWAKKILEWSATPQEAFATAIRLNDRYSLDGRDPNGYAGVSWCFGTHDRPWPERPVYGTVRCMMESGLRKKFDVDAYIRAFQ